MIYSRFQSSDQCLIYLHGRLTGLRNTSRYDLPEELVTELTDMTMSIKECIDRVDSTREKDKHSTK